MPVSETNHQISLFHRAFDKLYPAIRYWHERVNGNAWFSQITSQLWLGGAPDYPRDYQFILDHAITAVLNIRAEREDDVEYYTHHNIQYISLKVPDVAAPDPDRIHQGALWIRDQVSAGRSVLVHCAKGRGRSATLAAAYLMLAEGLELDQAVDRLEAARRLTKIEARHRHALEEWKAIYL